jgi:tetratricopeptide (TPR) repeat protein
MRLRSFLMSDSRVMIIAAATRWFSDVANVDKPFFEFFRGFDLHALNFEEMRECLAGVAEARGDQRVLDTLKNHPQSLEALHILTGGNPRLIRTFYRLLNEGLHGELRHQLERLIDDYTPYLKAIIDALPGQQQRVLDAIALQWNPCDVATVARLTRLPSNQVSAQIKALNKAGLVSEVPALGTLKKKAYMLTDRFSNIHYLMRHDRAGQLRMHWFVMTLRVLFDDDEFAAAVAKTVRLTAAGSDAASRDGLAMAHAALDVAGSDQARRLFLDRVTGSMEFDDDVDVAFAEKLCREAITRNPKDALAHLKGGRLLKVHLKRFPEAEAAYRKAIELDSKYALPWNNLGLLLTECMDRCDEAESAYRKAIELDPKFAWPWNNLGDLLTEKLCRHDEAEAAYRKAIELDPKYAFPRSNLARRLTSAGRSDEARSEASIGLKLQPNDSWTQRVFRELCFDDVRTLQAALPEVSQWCREHPDENVVVRFLLDAWLAYAQVATAAEALKLLDAQPAEVRLIFEALSDALIAHADLDHLHRLAPERRAPVLKLLERLNPAAKKKTK